MFTLGRIPSETDDHIKKYPLTLETLSGPTPMAIGVNWYTNFDSPIQAADGNWWIGQSKNLGSIRGGHCVCLRAKDVSDRLAWWEYYNQGSEGRCVQFGVSRMMTLLNRRRYEIRETDAQGRWLYYEAQKIDEWAGGAYPGAFPQYEGTSVNAALKVVRDRGIIRFDYANPTTMDGISTFRWATDWEDVKRATGFTSVNYVPFYNSWGTQYPHAVRIPDAVGARLLAEDGEFGVVTDR